MKRFKISTVRMPEDRCPFCHVIVDATTSLRGARPEAGDFSLCAECQNLCIFDERLRLRKPSAQEMARMSSEELVEINQMRGELALQKFRANSRLN